MATHGKRRSRTARFFSQRIRHRRSVINPSGFLCLSNAMTICILSKNPSYGLFRTRSRASLPAFGIRVVYCGRAASPRLCYLCFIPLWHWLFTPDSLFNQRHALTCWRSTRHTVRTDNARTISRRIIPGGCSPHTSNALHGFHHALSQFEELGLWSFNGREGDTISLTLISW